MRTKLSQRRLIAACHTVRATANCTAFDSSILATWMFASIEFVLCGLMHDFGGGEGATVPAGTKMLMLHVVLQHPVITSLCCVAAAIAHVAAGAVGVFGASGSARQHKHHNPAPMAAASAACSSAALVVPSRCDLAARHMNSTRPIGSSCSMWELASIVVEHMLLRPVLHLMV